MEENVIVIDSSDSDEDEFKKGKSRKEIDASRRNIGTKDDKLTIWAKKARAIIFYQDNDKSTFNQFPYRKFKELLDELKASKLRNKVYFWENVINWILDIIYSYKDVQDDDKFNLILTEIITEYVNYKCRIYSESSKLDGNNNEKEKIINEILNVLATLFREKYLYIVFTLLKINIKSEYKEILYPIFNKYLSNKNLYCVNDIVSYLAIVFCYRQWKKLINTANEEEHLNENAIGKLPKRVPVANSINQSFLNINNVLKTARCERFGTRILLEDTKLNVDDAIRKYFQEYENHIDLSDILQICNSLQNTDLQGKRRRRLQQQQQQERLSYFKNNLSRTNKKSTNNDGKERTLNDKNSSLQKMICNTNNRLSINRLSSNLGNTISNNNLYSDGNCSNSNNDNRNKNSVKSSISNQNYDTIDITDENSGNEEDANKESNNLASGILRSNEKSALSLVSMYSSSESIVLLSDDEGTEPTKKSENNEKNSNNEKSKNRISESQSKSRKAACERRRSCSSSNNNSSSSDDDEAECAKTKDETVEQLLWPLSKMSKESDRQPIELENIPQETSNNNSNSTAIGELSSVPSQKETLSIPPPPPPPPQQQNSVEVNDNDGKRSQLPGIPPRISTPPSSLLLPPVSIGEENSVRIQRTKSFVQRQKQECVQGEVSSTTTSLDNQNSNYEPAIISMSSSSSSSLASSVSSLEVHSSGNLEDDIQGERKIDDNIILRISVDDAISSTSELEKEVSNLSLNQNNSNNHNNSNSISSDRSRNEISIAKSSQNYHSTNDNPYGLEFLKSSPSFDANHANNSNIVATVQQQHTSGLSSVDTKQLPAVVKASENIKKNDVKRINSSYNFGEGTSRSIAFPAKDSNESQCRTQTITTTTTVVTTANVSDAKVIFSTASIPSHRQFEFCRKKQQKSNNDNSNNSSSISKTDKCSNSETITNASVYPKTKTSCIPPNDDAVSKVEANNKKLLLSLPTASVTETKNVQHILQKAEEFSIEKNESKEEFNKNSSKTDEIILCHQKNIEISVKCEKNEMQNEQLLGKKVDLRRINQGTIYDGKNESKVNTTEKITDEIKLPTSNCTVVDVTETKKKPIQCDIIKELELDTKRKDSEKSSSSIILNKSGVLDAEILEHKVKKEEEKKSLNVKNLKLKSPKKEGEVQKKSNEIPINEKDKRSENIEEVKSFEKSLEDDKNTKSGIMIIGGDVNEMELNVDKQSNNDLDEHDDILKKLEMAIQDADDRDVIYREKIIKTEKETEIKESKENKLEESLKKQQNKEEKEMKSDKIFRIHSVDNETSKAKPTERSILTKPCNVIQNMSTDDKFKNLPCDIENITETSKVIEIKSNIVNESTLLSELEHEKEKQDIFVENVTCDITNLKLVEEKKNIEIAKQYNEPIIEKQNTNYSKSNKNYSINKNQRFTSRENRDVPKIIVDASKDQNSVDVETTVTAVATMLKKSQSKSFKAENSFIHMKSKNNEVKTTKMDIKNIEKTAAALEQLPEQDGVKKRIPMTSKAMKEVNTLKYLESSPHVTQLTIEEIPVRIEQNIICTDGDVVSKRGSAEKLNKLEEEKPFSNVVQRTRIRSDEKIKRELRVYRGPRTNIKNNETKIIKNILPELPLSKLLDTEESVLNVQSNDKTVVIKKEKIEENSLQQQKHEKQRQIEKHSSSENKRAEEEEEEFLKIPFSSSSSSSSLTTSKFEQISTYCSKVRDSGGTVTTANTSTAKIFTIKPKHQIEENLIDSKSKRKSVEKFEVNNEKGGKIKTLIGNRKQVSTNFNQNDTTAAPSLTKPKYKKFEKNQFYDTENRINQNTERISKEIKDDEKLILKDNKKKSNLPEDILLHLKNSTTRTEIKSKNSKNSKCNQKKAIVISVDAAASTVESSGINKEKSFLTSNNEILCKNDHDEFLNRNKLNLEDNLKSYIILSEKAILSSSQKNSKNPEIMKKISPVIRKDRVPSTTSTLQDVKPRKGRRLITTMLTQPIPPLMLSNLQKKAASGETLNLIPALNEAITLSLPQLQTSSKEINQIGESSLSSSLPHNLYSPEVSSCINTSSNFCSSLFDSKSNYPFSEVTTPNSIDNNEEKKDTKFSNNDLLDVEEKNSEISENNFDSSFKISSPLFDCIIETQSIDSDIDDENMSNHGQMKLVYLVDESNVVEVVNDSCDNAFDPLIEEIASSGVDLNTNSSNSNSNIDNSLLLLKQNNYITPTTTTTMSTSTITTTTPKVIPQTTSAIKFIGKPLTTNEISLTFSSTSFDSNSKGISKDNDELIFSDIIEDSRIKTIIAADKEDINSKIDAVSLETNENNLIDEIIEESIEEEEEDNNENDCEKLTENNLDTINSSSSTNKIRTVQLISPSNFVSNKNDNLSNTQISRQQHQPPKICILSNKKFRKIQNFRSFPSLDYTLDAYKKFKEIKFIELKPNKVIDNKNQITRPGLWQNMKIEKQEQQQKQQQKLLPSQNQLNSSHSTSVIDAEKCIISTETVPSLVASIANEVQPNVENELSNDNHDNNKICLNEEQDIVNLPICSDNLSIEDIIEKSVPNKASLACEIEQKIVENVQDSIIPLEPLDDNQSVDVTLLLKNNEELKEIEEKIIPTKDDAEYPATLVNDNNEIEIEKVEITKEESVMLSSTEKNTFSSSPSLFIAEIAENTIVSTSTKEISENCEEISNEFEKEDNQQQSQQEQEQNELSSALEPAAQSFESNSTEILSDRNELSLIHKTDEVEEKVTEESISVENNEQKDNIPPYEEETVIVESLQESVPAYLDDDDGGNNQIIKYDEGIENEKESKIIDEEERKQQEQNEKLVQDKQEIDLQNQENIIDTSKVECNDKDIAEVREVSIEKSIESEEEISKNQITTVTEISVTTGNSIQSTISTVNENNSLEMNSVESTIVNDNDTALTILPPVLALEKNDVQLETTTSENDTSIALSPVPSEIETDSEKIPEVGENITISSEFLSAGEDDVFKPNSDEIPKQLSLPSSLPLLTSQSNYTTTLPAVEQPKEPIILESVMANQEVPQSAITNKETEIVSEIKTTPVMTNTISSNTDTVTTIIAHKEDRKPSKLPWKKRFSQSGSNLVCDYDINCSSATNTPLLSSSENENTVPAAKTMVSKINDISSLVPQVSVATPSPSATAPSLPLPVAAPLQTTVLDNNCKDDQTFWMKKIGLCKSDSYYAKDLETTLSEPTKIDLKQQNDEIKPINSQLILYENKNKNYSSPVPLIQQQQQQQQSLPPQNDNHQLTTPSSKRNYIHLILSAAQHDAELSAMNESLKEKEDEEPLPKRKGRKKGIKNKPRKPVQQTSRTTRSSCKIQSSPKSILKNPDEPRLQSKQKTTVSFAEETEVINSASSPVISGKTNENIENDVETLKTKKHVQFQHQESDTIENDDAFSPPFFFSYDQKIRTYSSSKLKNKKESQNSIKTSESNKSIDKDLSNCISIESNNQKILENATITSAASSKLDVIAGHHISNKKTILENKNKAIEDEKDDDKVDMIIHSKSNDSQDAISSLKKDEQKINNDNAINSDAPSLASTSENDIMPQSLFKSFNDVEEPPESEYILPDNDDTVANKEIKVEINDNHEAKQQLNENDKLETLKASNSNVTIITSLDSSQNSYRNKKENELSLKTPLLSPTTPPKRRKGKPCTIIKASDTLPFNNSVPDQQNIFNAIVENKNSSSSPTPTIPATKGKRGRPRKKPLLDISVAPEQPVVRRGRGRPRIKDNFHSDSNSTTSTVSTTTTTTTSTVVSAIMSEEVLSAFSPLIPELISSPFLLPFNKQNDEILITDNKESDLPSIQDKTHSKIENSHQQQNQENKEKLSIDNKNFENNEIINEIKKPKSKHKKEELKINENKNYLLRTEFDIPAHLPNKIADQYLPPPPAPPLNFEIKDEIRKDEKIQKLDKIQIHKEEFSKLDLGLKKSFSIVSEQISSPKIIPANKSKDKSFEENNQSILLKNDEISKESTITTSLEKKLHEVAEKLLETAATVSDNKVILDERQQQNLSTLLLETDHCEMMKFHKKEDSEEYCTTNNIGTNEISENNNSNSVMLDMVCTSKLNQKIHDQVTYNQYHFSMKETTTQKRKRKSKPVKRIKNNEKQVPEASTIELDLNKICPEKIKENLVMVTANKENSEIENQMDKKLVNNDDDNDQRISLSLNEPIDLSTTKKTEYKFSSSSLLNHQENDKKYQNSSIVESIDEKNRKNDTVIMENLNEQEQQQNIVQNENNKTEENIKEAIIDSEQLYKNNENKEINTSAVIESLNLNNCTLNDSGILQKSDLTDNEIVRTDDTQCLDEQKTTISPSVTENQNKIQLSHSIEKIIAKSHTSPTKTIAKQKRLKSMVVDRLEHLSLENETLQLGNNQKQIENDEAKVISELTEDNSGKITEKADNRNEMVKNEESTITAEISVEQKIDSDNLHESTTAELNSLKEFNKESQISSSALMTKPSSQYEILLKEIELTESKDTANGDEIMTTKSIQTEDKDETKILSDDDNDKKSDLIKQEHEVKLTTTDEELLIHDKLENDVQKLSSTSPPSEIATSINKMEIVKEFIKENCVEEIEKEDDDNKQKVSVSQLSPDEFFGFDEKNRNEQIKEQESPKQEEIGTKSRCEPFDEEEDTIQTHENEVETNESHKIIESEDNYESLQNKSSDERNNDGISIKEVENCKEEEISNKIMKEEEKGKENVEEIGNLPNEDLSSGNNQSKEKIEGEHEGISHENTDTSVPAISLVMNDEVSKIEEMKRITSEVVQVENVGDLDYSATMLAIEENKAEHEQKETDSKKLLPTDVKMNEEPITSSTTTDCESISSNEKRVKFAKQFKICLTKRRATSGVNKSDVLKPKKRRRTIDVKLSELPDETVPVQSTELDEKPAQPTELDEKPAQPTESDEPVLVQAMESDETVPVQEIEPDETVPIQTTGTVDKPIKTTKPDVLVSVQAMEPDKKLVQLTEPDEPVPVQAIEHGEKPIQSAELDEPVPVQEMEPAETVPVQATEPDESVPVQAVEHNEKPVQPTELDESVPVQAIEPDEIVPIQPTEPDEAMCIQSTELYEKPVQTTESHEKTVQATKEQEPTEQITEKVVDTIETSVSDTDKENIDCVSVEQNMEIGNKIIGQEEIEINNESIKEVDEISLTGKAENDEHNQVEIKAKKKSESSNYKLVEEEKKIDKEESFTEIIDIPIIVEKSTNEVDDYEKLSQASTSTEQEQEKNEINEKNLIEETSLDDKVNEKNSRQIETPGEHQVGIESEKTKEICMNEISSEISISAEVLEEKMDHEIANNDALIQEDTVLITEISFPKESTTLKAPKARRRKRRICSRAKRRKSKIYTKHLIEACKTKKCRVVVKKLKKSVINSYLAKYNETLNNRNEQQQQDQEMLMEDDSNVTVIESKSIIKQIEAVEKTITKAEELSTEELEKPLLTAEKSVILPEHSIALNSQKELVPETQILANNMRENAGALPKQEEKEKTCEIIDTEVENIDNKTIVSNIDNNDDHITKQESSSDEKSKLTLNNTTIATSNDDTSSTSLLGNSMSQLKDILDVSNLSLLETAVSFSNIEKIVQKYIEQPDQMNEVSCEQQQKQQQQQQQQRQTIKQQSNQLDDKISLPTSIDDAIIDADSNFVEDWPPKTDDILTNEMIEDTLKELVQLSEVNSKKMIPSSIEVGKISPSSSSPTLTTASTMNNANSKFSYDESDTSPTIDVLNPDFSELFTKEILQNGNIPQQNSIKANISNQNHHQNNNSIQPQPQLQQQQQQQNHRKGDCMINGMLEGSLGADGLINLLAESNFMITYVRSEMNNSTDNNDNELFNINTIDPHQITTNRCLVNSMCKCLSCTKIQEQQQQQQQQKQYQNNNNEICENNLMMMADKFGDCSDYYDYDIQDFNSVGFELFNPLMPLDSSTLDFHLGNVNTVGGCGVNGSIDNFNTDLYTQQTVESTPSVCLAQSTPKKVNDENDKNENLINNSFSLSDSLESKLQNNLLEEEPLLRDGGRENEVMGITNIIEEKEKGSSISQKSFTDFCISEKDLNEASCSNSYNKEKKIQSDEHSSPLSQTTIESDMIISSPSKSPSLQTTSNVKTSILESPKQATNKNLTSKSKSHPSIPFWKGRIASKEISNIVDQQQRKQQQYQPLSSSSSTSQQTCSIDYSSNNSASSVSNSENQDSSSAVVEASSASAFVNTVSSNQKIFHMPDLGLTTTATTAITTSINLINNTTNSITSNSHQMKCTTATVTTTTSVVATATAAASTEISASTNNSEDKVRQSSSLNLHNKSDGDSDVSVVADNKILKDQQKSNENSVTQHCDIGIKRTIDSTDATTDDSEPPKKKSTTESENKGKDLSTMSLFDRLKYEKTVDVPIPKSTRAKRLPVPFPVSEISCNSSKQTTTITPIQSPAANSISSLSDDCTSTLSPLDHYQTNSSPIIDVESIGPTHICPSPSISVSPSPKHITTNSPLIVRSPYYSNTTDAIDSSPLLSPSPNSRASYLDPHSQQHYQQQRFSHQSPKPLRKDNKPQMSKSFPLATHHNQPKFNQNTNSTSKLPYSQIQSAPSVFKITVPTSVPENSHQHLPASKQEKSSSNSLKYSALIEESLQEQEQTNYTKPHYRRKHTISSSSSSLSDYFIEHQQPIVRYKRSASPDSQHFTSSRSKKRFNRDPLIPTLTPQQSFEMMTSHIARDPSDRQKNTSNSSSVSSSEHFYARLSSSSASTTAKHSSVSSHQFNPTTLKPRTMPHATLPPPDSKQTKFSINTDKKQSTTTLACTTKPKVFIINKCPPNDKNNRNNNNNNINNIKKIPSKLSSSIYGSIKPYDRPIELSTSSSSPVIVHTLQKIDNIKIETSKKSNEDDLIELKAKLENLPTASTYREHRERQKKLEELENKLSEKNSSSNDKNEIRSSHHHHTKSNNLGSVNNRNSNSRNYREENFTHSNKHGSSRSNAAATEKLSSSSSHKYYMTTSRHHNSSSSSNLVSHNSNSNNTLKTGTSHVDDINSTTTLSSTTTHKVKPLTTVEPWSYEQISASELIEKLRERRQKKNK